MVYSSVITLLEKSGARFRIHRHSAVTTIEEANRKVPHLTRNLLKTVVFKIKDADWILAVVSGDERVHYKKLAEAVGVKRTDLRAIGASQVESELGFQIGGVGPFPVQKNICVVFDEAILRLDDIFCGSGRNTQTIEMKAADLIRLAKGIVHAIRR